MTIQESGNRKIWMEWTTGIESVTSSRPVPFNPLEKCGSTEFQRGEIFPRSTTWDVRFKPENAAALAFKNKIKALACSSCGYIELFLVADK